MLIRKLTLRNFRNFKNCEIEFSCDPQKNITIVLGQNTYGKTTLVKSFIWCLYRENQFDDKILLNSDVAYSLLQSQEAYASVEVELEHKGYSYLIKTKECYALNSSGNISVRTKACTSIVKVNDDNNSEAVPLSRVNEEIDSILRPELKDYFFFDGERNSIDNISKKTNLTSAVTNILGLNKVEMIKDYYDPTKNQSVTSYLRNELVSVDENALDNLNGKLEKAQGRKEKISKDISDTGNEISDLKGQLSEKEGILDANRDIESDQNEKKRIDKDLNELKSKKEADFTRLIQSFNSSQAFLKVLFANSYLKFNFKDLKDKSNFSSENSYKGINEEAVEELIKNGKCICGAIIKTGNDAYKHLIDAKQHMEPHDFGKYMSDFESSESSNVFSAQSSLENITTIAGTINDTIEEIDNDESRLKEITSRITGRADVGQIQEDINNIKIQIGVQENTLKRLNDFDLPLIDNEIENISNQITSSSSKNDRNCFINKCLSYANNIYKLADKKLNESKITIKTELLKEVGDIFATMYHGNRKVTIDDNFKADTVVDYKGGDKQLDKSTGLGTVVNYSFVAGLMTLAKKSILSGDDMDDENTQNEIYPLVMDAPFSNTDDEHIKNICKALPNFCDQIIMFVMQKDFNYANDSISDRIGKMYKLNRISETESIVEEEE